MQEKKNTPLIVFHLILMVVLIALSIFTAVKSFLFSADINYVPLVRSFGSFSIANVPVLISGIIYVFKGYKKDAAVYYKTMLVLSAIAALFAINQVIVFEISGIGFTLFGVWVPLCLVFIKIVILIVLAFMKNLGKKNSWILFVILFLSDILFAIFFGNLSSILNGQMVVISRTITILSRVFIDVTIGLAIKGKYDDKDARGTI